MERLDFASVMAVLRRNIPDENFGNQADFLYSLFADFADADSGVDDVVDFYTGQACRWINGNARLSPNIIDFYKNERNKVKLFNRIESEILSLMSDSAMTAQELYDLVMQATNVSVQKKMELTDGFSFEDRNDEAMFITDVLCLAMQLRFKKRDVRKKQLLTPGNLSPAVVDYIFDTDIPRPCRWFLGRETELEQLHGLLVDHSKVFLQGIPGIGKSELAKAYAKRYGKEYTNVIYVNYLGDLMQTVIDLDFADDLPDETDDTRFKWHNRFLRSLREDTLLIVDNFNVTASQDQFLGVMLKYRCRILFTTRSRYENQISLEVGELNRQIKADNKLLRDLRSVFEKIAKAVKNTVPAIAEAMETLRRNMLIFRYQILHTKANRRSIKNTLADVVPVLRQCALTSKGRKKTSSLILC